MAGFKIPVEGVAQQNGPPKHVVETSRTYRFRILFLDPLTRDFIVYARKCTLPAIEVSAITMHRGQDEIYLPGKNRWSTVEISFYRVHAGENDDAAKQIYEWWSTKLLVTAESRLASADNRGLPKRNAQIGILDGVDKLAWKYELLGCWPEKVTPDALDYSSNAIAEIGVTLRVDKVRELKGESREAAVAMCGPSDVFLSTNAAFDVAPPPSASTGQQ